MYVEIPENLTERTVILEFGADAYRFYQNRIEERKRNGKIYYNPLKTIYIWAATISARKSVPNKSQIKCGCCYGLSSCMICSVRIMCRIGKTTD